LVLLVRKNQILERSLHPMRKVTPITEQFQHFVRDLKETFWGDLYGKTRLAWKEFLEEQSRKERDRSVGVEDYERAGEKRRGYRNGWHLSRILCLRDSFFALES